MPSPRSRQHKLVRSQAESKSSEKVILQLAVGAIARQTGRHLPLLEDILNSHWDDDSGEMPVRAEDLYMERGAPWHSSHAELWGEFCYQVREKNALIPFHEYFEENFERASVSLPGGSTLYRARLGFQESSDRSRSPYSGPDIGAPPPEKAEAGRANRCGRRVLYCSYEEKTAIAETRPAAGLIVSVCSLELNQDVNILDISQEIEPPNPFLDETLAYDLEVLELLHQFGDDMSRPLERNDDKALYLPSQRLAEYVEQSKYAGICYPSALNPGGKNLVLFDPSHADIKPSKLVKVTGVAIDYTDES